VGPFFGKFFKIKFDFLLKNSFLIFLRGSDPPPGYTHTQICFKIYFTGTFAGSPGYFSDSSSSSSSTGILCDVIQSIISALTEAALKALKDYIKSRLGRSAEDNSDILIQACQYLRADLNLTDSDHEIFETILNLENINKKSEFGFDLDAAWECIKDMFSSSLDDESTSSEYPSSE